MDSEGAFTVPGVRRIFAGVSTPTEGASVTGSSVAVASPTALRRPRSGSPRRIVRHCVNVVAGFAMLTLAACSGTGSPVGGGPAPLPSGQNASSSAGPAGLSLVAIGDSIPYNSPGDCPGCTGFVDQYAKAVEKATGKHVTVQNLSQHTSLTLPQLLDELGSFKQPLSAADVILVGIAHNSFELNADAPCGRPVINQTPVWSVVDARCATKSAAKYQPMYQKLYSQIAAWRNGKPTILRTINRYNDWIGFAGAHLTHAQDLKTKTMLDPWDKMLCSTATANGFACADIYHAFNGPAGTKAAAGLLGPDYTHPSQRGNDTIESVLEALGYAPLA
jgi:lysophospholipase L1-like esterase